MVNVVMMKVIACLEFFRRGVVMDSRGFDQNTIYLKLTLLVWFNGVIYRPRSPEQCQTARDYF